MQCLSVKTYNNFYCGIIFAHFLDDRLGRPLPSCFLLWPGLLFDPFFHPPTCSICINFFSGKLGVTIFIYDYACMDAASLFRAMF